MVAIVMAYLHFGGVACVFDWRFLVGAFQVR